MEPVGEFDYIVVGGGTAGCVAAARLSESGEHQVVLLEAGGEDDSFWIHVPLGYGKLYDDPKYNWCFDGEPEPELNNVASYQPRGKTLGGTGAINGMVYMRGQHQDYDQWRQLGNTGWGYDDVLPYFLKSEDNERGASKYHGVGGPIRVTDIPKHELADAFLKAVTAAGHPLNPDFNGPTQEGFGYTQMTTRNSRRSNTATAFLHPARNRSNLSVYLYSQATRILIRDGKAVGVEFMREGVLHTVMARREVILSGGSFNSPQLLQLSGIGPGDLLQQFGIPVVSHRPGVGANLQDHFGVGTSYRCTKPITVNDDVNNPLRRMAMGLQYLLFGTGTMATNASLIIGFLRTDPALAAPDIRVLLTGWNRAASGRSKEGLGLANFSGFTVPLGLLHPESRGTVRIKSADPMAAPEIIFNLFKSEKDQRTCVKGMRIIKRIMDMAPLKPYIAEEILPGPKVQTDDDIIAFCRQRGRSNHHAASTCKMGIDDMAVVDPRLRVYGVGGLRVMDASIMPNIIGGNTNTPTTMIAEKGCAMVLEDAETGKQAKAA